MRSGLLRCRVEIQERSTAQVAGGPGDQATSWSVAFSAYAAIEPLSGRELVLAQAAQSAGTHRIRLRYRKDKTVGVGMRVRYGARYFDIVSPPRDTLERNREWLFEVTEGLNNG